MNYDAQYYGNIPLRLINRNYAGYKAKRYTINSTNQNVWIPNVYLHKDGTIKKGAELDFIFYKALRKLEIAGIEWDRKRKVKNAIVSETCAGCKWEHQEHEGCFRCRRAYTDEYEKYFLV